jgi:5-methylcytosine-specific restriction protein A
MPAQPPVHRPAGWQDKRARDRDYAVHRNKRALALLQSVAWRKARDAFLSTHPFCISIGCGALATVVDHSVPHRGDPTIFWDRSRWQPMCSNCHGRKTVMRDGGFGNARR